MSPTTKDIFRHDALISIEIPPALAVKNVCDCVLKYRISQKIGFHYAYFLTGIGESKYIGILDISGELIPTGKSELTKDDFPVKLLERVAFKVVANKVDDITKYGFSVTVK